MCEEDRLKLSETRDAHPSGPVNSAALSFARRLQASDEWLAAAFLAAGDGLWELHVSTGTLSASPRFAQMLGYDVAEGPATLQEWMSLLHPDDRPVVEYLMESHLTGRLAAFEAEYRAAGAGGAWHWVSARGQTTERSADGDSVRMMGTTTDISERRQLEIERVALLDETERGRRELELANERLRVRTEELRVQAGALERETREREVAMERERAARVEADDARLRAELANRGKADFLSQMSHELRTPLNAVMGYIELITMELYGAVTPEQRTALARMGKGVQHLLSLTSDVLEFARVESGEIQYHMADIPLVDIVADLDAMLAPQFASAGIRYVLGAGCPPSTRVRAAAEKTRQVLINLLTNAMKFTPKGGTVTVDCGTRGDMAWVRVADTGRGIPANKLSVIFEPFVQVDRDQKTNHTVAQQGVGLGLAISREMARAMGGDVTVESELGRGSAFTLLLPQADAAETLP